MKMKDEKFRVDLLIKITNKMFKHKLVLNNNIKEKEKRKKIYIYKNKRKLTRG